ncbi:MAG: hypothetical protein DRJ01_14270, partial [Bacteroidetes bacterium]
MNYTEVLTSKGIKVDDLPRKIYGKIVKHNTLRKQENLTDEQKTQLTGLNDEITTDIIDWLADEKAKKQQAELEAKKQAEAEAEA